MNVNQPTTNSTDGDAPPPPKLWAVVELFGHQRIAGAISEQTFGGATFVRVDVPKVGTIQAHTRSFGPSAIYGINWCDERTALAAAMSIADEPLHAYGVIEAPSSDRPRLPNVAADEPAEIYARLEGAADTVVVGEIFDGALVKNVFDFGAIVELLPDRYGLLHITQIAHHIVVNIRDYLAEGQLVRVKVIEQDGKGRVKLSIKALLDR